jgi:glycosyltransferase involved in cell wall biosynthesis
LSDSLARPSADRRGHGLVSVVLSFRNEEDTIPTLVTRLETVFAAERTPYELVFVNDASTDESLAILRREHERNRRIKIVNLSRRFGVAEGVLAGMAASSGDAVIYMDSDLQDPPEVIRELLARWRGGADVVHTVRTRRHGESVLKMWATRAAYRLIQSGSSIDLAVDAGDFKLLSRVAVDHLLRLRESDPYLRGLVVWLGFTQAFVPYERGARNAGRTHFPFFSKNPWKTFVIGLTSFSFVPVHACLVLAGVGLLASGTLLVSAGVLAARDSALALKIGFVGVLTFFWGTTLASVGMLGVYLIRVYKDVRSRPPYIVQSTIGFQAPPVVAPAPPEAAEVK